MSTYPVPVLGRAVLGSKTGRDVSYWERRCRIAERRLEMLGQAKFFHTCPDGGTSFLAHAAVCAVCAWSPSLPVPRIDECGERLLQAFTRELAVAWTEELADDVRTRPELARHELQVPNPSPKPRRLQLVGSADVR